VECRWLSVGSDLKFDARRDLEDVGATHCVPPVEGMWAFVAVVNCHFLVACVCVSTMQVCYFQSGVA
jgi:hypothetical protein